MNKRVLIAKLHILFKILLGCRNAEDRPDLGMDPLDPKILSCLSAAVTTTGPKIANRSQ